MDPQERLRAAGGRDQLSAGSDGRADAGLREVWPRRHVTVKKMRTSEGQRFPIAGAQNVCVRARVHTRVVTCFKQTLLRAVPPISNHRMQDVVVPKVPVSSCRLVSLPINAHGGVQHRFAVLQLGEATEGESKGWVCPKGTLQATGAGK